MSIKQPADWSALLDDINAVEIEGALIPFETGFTQTDLQGVSGWAILFSLWYDNEFDVEFNTEIPSRLQYAAQAESVYMNNEVFDEDSDDDSPASRIWAAWGYLARKISQWLPGNASALDCRHPYRSEKSVMSNKTLEDVWNTGGTHYELDPIWRGDPMNDEPLSADGLNNKDEWPYSRANQMARGRVNQLDPPNFWVVGGGSWPVNGPYEWSNRKLGDSSFHDAHATRLDAGHAMLTPCMANGRTSATVGWTFEEYANQIEQDVQFIRKRAEMVQAQISAFGLVSEDEDFNEDDLERIAELQEAAQDRDLTAAEQAELAGLLEAVAPAGMTARAEAQQRLDEMRENGEAGEFAAAMRAQEQCFLMAKIIEMSKLNIAKKPEYRVDGGPAAHMVHGEIGTLVSKLMLDPAYSAYYFMPPDKLSYLTPSIKLYQVLHEYYENPNSQQESPLAKPVDFEVPFYQNITQYSIDQIMNGQEGRGGQVGIKSFDWTYQGSNPASSRRDIKATLVLECQNFSDITLDRTVTLKDENGDEFTHNWMYADLAIRRNRDHMAAPNCLYSQLKVVVGWGIKEISDDERQALNFTDEEIDAIRNSQMTMFLTIIDHSFDIRDDATVEFKIEYRAYIEGAFTSPEASVLVTPELLESKKERDEALASLQRELQNPNGTCRPEDMAELRRRFTQTIQREKEQAHMALLRGLEGDTPDESKIYVRTVDLGEMLRFMDAPFSGVTPVPEDPDDTSRTEYTAELPPTDSSGNASTTVTDPRAPADYLDRIEAAVNFPSTVDFNNQESETTDQMMESVYAEEEDGKLQICYFFLGDLIHVALKNIDSADPVVAGDNKKFDKTRLLLGPIEVSDFQDANKKYQVNLADVPISVNYFLEWFLNRIQAKQEVVWYLMDFIKDVVKNLVYKTLNSNDCFEGAIRQKANFQNLYLVGSSVGGTDDPIQELIDGGSGQLTSKWKRFFASEVDTYGADTPILSVDKSDEPIPSTQQYNYILMYASDPQPRNLRGNFEEDLYRGVYHFHLGTNRGLVKRIKFTKTDQPYIREARYMNQGFDGLSQLREPYKIDVEMFGNSRIFPGQTVYVDPRGLGYGLGSPADDTSKAWLLGLGGYHMVINATHTIARGAFDTKLNLVWVLRGSEGGETTTGADGSETPARHTTNCEPLNNYGEPSGYDPDAAQE